MISLPFQPKILEKKDNFARFEIEGLYPGYGITIGNSLRRVLLSSLQGTAVTFVKIKGASHEFTTIPGVLEDMITITLNLKQLRFKLYTEEPLKISLKTKGEKEIKGSDFDLPSQAELINKDVHIATVTDKKVEFEMEITVEKGIGYQPAERRKKEKLEIGMMALDAIFTPVRRVSYRVENMRVGDRTDFDRIYLDLQTDGSIAPEEALFQASEILVNHFSLFVDTFKEEEKPKESKIGKGKDEEDFTKIKVEDMKLSTRTLNALTNNNIKTLGGILKKSEESLLELEGMGETGIKEIRKKLKKKELELK